MEDPRTGILRFGLRKVFILLVVAIPGRAYFGKPRLLHLQRCFLEHRQAPDSYRGVKIQICSHAAEINVKDGGQPPRPPQGQQPWNGGAPYQLFLYNLQTFIYMTQVVFSVLDKLIFCPFLIVFNFFIHICRKWAKSKENNFDEWIKKI